MKRSIPPTSPVTSPSKKFLIANSGSKIKTFIFMKMVTTNVNSPRIVELCLIAIPARELTNNNRAVRITDKLLLSFSSDEPIQIHTSQLSSLTNKMLSEKLQFCKHSANLFSGFLSRQQQPVCFLSHLGFQLEFPVLKGELEHNGFDMNRLNGLRVFCADTSIVFKFMDERTDDLTLVDVGAYSVESIYRRYLSKSPPGDIYTAHGACVGMINVVRSVARQFIQAISYRSFASITARSIPRFDNDEFESSQITNGGNNNDEIATETYVYLDLETTGLGIDAKITELSLIAIRKHDLTPITNGDENKDIISTLPRVRDILTLCVNPAVAIAPRAAQITGLCNEDLEACQKLSFGYGVAKILEDFLLHHKHPITFLTYNGNQFDFPIFEKHCKTSHNFNINRVFSSIYSGDVMQCLNEEYSFQGKLSDVYSTFSNGRKAENLHSAEDDNNVLINVTMLQPAILRWIEENRKKLFDIV